MARKKRPIARQEILRALINEPTLKAAAKKLRIGSADNLLRRCTDRELYAEYERTRERGILRRTATLKKAQHDRWEKRDALLLNETSSYVGFMKERYGARQKHVLQLQGSKTT